MPLYIATNVSSLHAQTNLGKTQNMMQTTFSRLSSGLRINSAADDAAGLGISESMNAQIRSYAVAERNANDGISMVQTADGATAQMSTMLARLRELGVQARNGSLQSADRANLNTEFQALLQEMDRIVDTTKFNGIDLLKATSNIKFQVGITTAASDQIDVAFGGFTTADLTVAGTDVTTEASAGTAIDAIDAAIANVNTKRAAFGAAMNRFQSTIGNIQSMKTNLSSANGRIRDADIAEESAQMARNQVLSQAGASILTQANQAPQLALSLLKG
jgi:flagellin